MSRSMKLGALLIVALSILGCSDSQEPTECESTIQSVAETADLRSGSVPECENTPE